MSRLPSVMIRSTSGRVAFARRSVVVMRSRSMTLVTRLRNVARRCAGLRPSLDPEFKMSHVSVPLLQPGGFLRRLEERSGWERRPDNAAVLVKFHAQGPSPILVQDFLDLVERLPAEVLGLEHLVFGLLNEFAESSGYSRS